MKNNLLTYVLIILSLCACSTEDNEPNVPEDVFEVEEKVEDKVAWLRFGEDGDESKILFLGNDKSYAVFNGKAGEGLMTLYLNSSVENDIEKGIMIYMDSEGKPEMIKIEDNYLIIGNLGESTFDLARCSNTGEYEYYWDAPFVSWSDSRTHSFFYYLWPGVTDFDWSWDEHIKAGILPFCLKVVSFAIDAGTLVWKPSGSSLAGYMLKLAEEMRKSGFKLGILDEMIIAGLTPLEILNKLGLDGDEYLKGNLKFSSRDMGLSLLSSTLNHMGDEGLNRMGQMKAITEPVFTGKEWQLKPNPGSVVFDPKASEKTVHIDTKSYWIIDEDGLDKSWCSAVKDGENLVVSVKENELGETRWCSVKVRTQMYSADIPPVLISITQHGVKFEVSPDLLSFQAEGGSKGVFIDMSDNITSWEITSVPSWVNIDKGKESFFVNVEESKESRSGIITVTGYASGGIRVDRQITVEQVNYIWDATSWDFSGHITCIIMGESVTQDWNFGIDIVDVSKNIFTLSGMFAGYEDMFKLKANDDGTLDMIYSESIREQGVSANATCHILLKRVDFDTSIGNASGEIFINLPNYGNFKSTVKGDLIGERRN